MLSGIQNTKKWCYGMDKPKRGFTQTKPISNSNTRIIIYRITDFTTDCEYAEQKSKEGYRVTALLF